MRIGVIVLIALSAMVSLPPLLRVEESYYSDDLRSFNSYGELTSYLTPTFSAQAQLFLMSPKQARSWSSSASGYSRTNIQVEGVDEADIVKTDGSNIYFVSRNTVLIVRAYPPEDAEVLSTLTIPGDLKQIFINEYRLVVFFENRTDSELRSFVDVYDVSEQPIPTLKREVAVDGCYVSSRMIGDIVYVVTMEEAAVYDGQLVLPRILIGDEVKTVPASDIYYSATTDDFFTYTTILAVNAKDETEQPQYKSIVLGNSATMYVSTQSIYLAVPINDATNLHRIDIADGQILYAASGRVAGRILNPFSMDEYQGYFRTATSTRLLQNNIYVLNRNLTTVGSLEDIAPGEQLHSARFMGDICYVVTFRKVDPFFAIDLSVPQYPRVLGELKASGYSDYLHPYDQGHVLGVGKETVAAEGDRFSWYQGVKISLFDVADKSALEELGKYVIGDRGTDTPVLTEHKAFLFDKERSLLVLPVSVAKIDSNEFPNGVPPYAYGKLVWQGAYVLTVSLDLQDKIAYRGKVTHIENGDLGDTSHYVTRALFIEDVLYTISEHKIKMNSLQDLTTINELNLEEA